jgi:bacteriorhodopsin
MNNLSLLLTDNQYSTVYNMLSFGTASMLFTAVFLFIARDRVLPRYRLAVIISGIVTAIAAYHYFRIFNSFEHAFAGAEANPYAYNVGYRYVDWLLTVPLLLVETVAVLALAGAAQKALLNKLVPASIAMIVLGYPGDAKLDLFGLSGLVWGVLSMIPFLYILYVLFVELTKSLDRQSDKVKARVTTLRYVLIATWAVYPITYFLSLNSAGFDADAFVTREIGYTIADVTAKCIYGLIIFSIARIKSAEDSAEFAKDETRD